MRRLRRRELAPEARHSLDCPLLRPEDAARLLAVKPSWIYDAVRTGRLPCLRVGRHIRFTQPMLECWLSEQAARQPGWR